MLNDDIHENFVQNEEHQETQLSFTKNRSLLETQLGFMRWFPLVPRPKIDF